MAMFSKLKQFKDLRDQGKKLQTMLEGEAVTTTSAGGQIALTMSGSLEISGLAIDASLLNPANKEKIEKGIKEAHGEALKKMQRTIATKMQQSGEFNLPGMN